MQPMRVVTSAPSPTYKCVMYTPDVVKNAYKGDIER